MRNDTADALFLRCVTPTAVCSAASVKSTWFTLTTTVDDETCNTTTDTCITHNDVDAGHNIDAAPYVVEICALSDIQSVFGIRCESKAYKRTSENVHNKIGSHICRVYAMVGNESYTLTCVRVYCTRYINVCALEYKIPTVATNALYVILSHSTEHILHYLGTLDEFAHRFHVVHMIERCIANDNDIVKS